MKIVPYILKSSRPGRRGHPAVSEGTKVYLIEHGLSFFRFSYLQRTDAEEVLKTLRAKGPLEAPCLIEDPEQTLHVCKLYRKRSR